MMLLLVVLLGMFLRGIKNGKHLFAIKIPPSFVKRGLTIPIYLKLISPTPLYKRGAFL